MAHLGHGYDYAVSFSLQKLFFFLLCIHLVLFIACEIILAHGPEIDLFQTVKTIRCSFLFGHASSMAGTGQKGWSVGSDQKSQLAIITEGGIRGS